MKRIQSGFTILEIIIVFVLLASIMGFVASKIFEGRDRAEQAIAKTKMISLAGEIERYRTDIGRYPDSLEALTKQPAGIDKWNGPYVRKAEDLKDPWGNEFRYRTGVPGKPFELMSLGADGKEGGEGADKDIVYSN